MANEKWYFINSSLHTVSDKQYKNLLIGSDSFIICLKSKQ